MAEEKSLATNVPPDSKLLFGDDLNKRLTEIHGTNKLKAKKVRSPGQKRLQVLQNPGEPEKLWVPSGSKIPTTKRKVKCQSELQEKEELKVCSFTSDCLLSKNLFDILQHEVSTYQGGNIAYHLHSWKEIRL